MQNESGADRSSRVLKREGNVVYLEPPQMVLGNDDEHADSSNPRCEGGVCTIQFKPMKPQRPAA